MVTYSCISLQDKRNELIEYKDGTQDSGYLAKQLLAAMQSEVVDMKDDSDCETKKTLKIKLTKKLQNDMKYRNIIVNGKIVCLTPEVIGNYVGKEIQLRSPMYCKGEHICSVCAGKMPYILDDKFIGLETSKVATTLLRLGMKKFHIANLKSNQIDPDEMLI